MKTQVETRRRRLSPPLKWHGGKHYLAERIVGLMPEHVHYVEPFFGGGAVLWAKPFEGVSEVVSDIYGRLMNFYRHLADPELFELFQRRVASLPVSKQLWQEAQKPAEDPLEDAVRFFIFNRQSRAGQMRDFATLSRNRTRRGMNEQVSSWLTAIDGLPEVHQRLRRVVVLDDDAISVIRQQDGPNTLIYADPPYLTETRTLTDVYTHEMTSGDHESLLDTLKQSKSSVMLRGYPNQLYARKLTDWNRVEIEIDNKASGSKKKRKMTEVVWMNF